ncbi:MAG: hypothetical protein GVY04_05855 [Cyanobacteria bacterium]|nr:hypothetical protein [Cyanobacteria bacterium GSL.Bin1]
MATSLFLVQFFNPIAPSNTRSRFPSIPKQRSRSLSHPQNSDRASDYHHLYLLRSRFPSLHLQSDRAGNPIRGSTICNLIVDYPAPNLKTRLPLAVTPSVNRVLQK